MSCCVVLFAFSLLYIIAVQGKNSLCCFYNYCFVAFKNLLVIQNGMFSVMLVSLVMMLIKFNIMQLNVVYTEMFS